MNDYSQLYKDSMELLDAHPELLKLDQMLIHQQLSQMNTETTQFLIPSKLFTLTNRDYADSRYYVLKVSKNACRALGIKMYSPNVEFTNIIIKKDDFEKTLEFLRAVNEYEKLEPIDYSKIKPSFIQQRREVIFEKVGALPGILEDQVQVFVDNRDRNYFLNRSVKDVRKDFLFESMNYYGNQAYVDRRLKHTRLNEVIKEKFKLDVKRVRIASASDLMKYKSTESSLGKSHDFFVED